MKEDSSSQATRVLRPEGPPDQFAETRSFPLVDRLQRTVAEAADRSGASVGEVPRWSTQAALFVLASRLGGEMRRADHRAFIDLARRSSDHGSRIFPDTSVWPAGAEGVAEVVATLDDVSTREIMMLVGRTLDYGRTLEWSIGEFGPSSRRNLVTAKSQGIFYTPMFVAKHLASRCLETYAGTACPQVCDPSVGGAAFLLAAADLLLHRFEPQVVRASLFGADTDPIAVEVAAILIDALCGLWLPGEPPPSLNANLLIGDAFGGPVGVPGPLLPGAIDWPNTFPQVFDGDRPGFDVVLVNPPFGRHKIDSDWLIAKEMHLDEVLLTNLRDNGRRRSVDLKNAGYYPLSSVGVLDKSRIGLERAMQLTADGGSVGALVPSTIAADNHSYLLRESLLTNWDVTEINEFPETARLFYDVSQAVSILHAVKGAHTIDVRVRSNVRVEADLSGEFSAEWPVSLLSRISPKLAIPLRTADHHGVLSQMHRYPALRDLHGVVNARGEVDVSAFDSALTDDPLMTPLVRGDQIDCYRTDLPSEKQSFVDTMQFQHRLARSPKYEHFQQQRIVGRQCSYLYRPKRLSFAAVPSQRAVANSCNYLLASEPAVMLYLLALLNSRLLNWRFKVTNSNNHVANSELADLPIPDPRSVPGELFAQICVHAERLSINPDPEMTESLDELVFELYGLSGTQARSILASEDT